MNITFQFLVAMKQMNISLQCLVALKKQMNIAEQCLVALKQVNILPCNV